MFSLLHIKGFTNMFYKFCCGNLKKVNNLNKILILIKIFSFRLETLKKIIFKRAKTFYNVSLRVKLSNSQCPSIIAQMAMSDLQRYPSQLCLIKYELSFNGFNFSFFFICGLFGKRLAHSLFIKSNGEEKKNNVFQVRKTVSIINILDHMKVSRVPFQSGHFHLSMNFTLYMQSL